MVLLSWISKKHKRNKKTIGKNFDIPKKVSFCVLMWVFRLSAGKILQAKDQRKTAPKTATNELNSQTTGYLNDRATERLNDRKTIYLFVNQYMSYIFSTLFDSWQCTTNSRCFNEGLNGGVTLAADG